MEFIKGKWYEWINPKFKTTSTTLWIVKGIELTNDNKLVYKERINRNKSYNLVKETYCEWDDELREADMNEVSKFLPEGHVDKIVEFKLPERWYVKPNNLEEAEILGKWYDKYRKVDIYANDIHAVKCTFEYGITIDFGFCKSSISTEITFEQFKKYVLKENSMNKVEAPKTFAIKSASKHLLKACWEELKDMGYILSRISNEEIEDFICTNENQVDKTTTKLDYSMIYTNHNVSIKSDIVFTLPQDYTKAIEYAKSAINSEYWNQNKVTKLNFGEVEFTIESGKDYAETAYGRVTKEEIRKAIEYIENPPKLVEYELSIHYNNTYCKITGLDDSTTFSYGFGCKEGSLEELKSIYKAFEN